MPFTIRGNRRIHYRIEGKGEQTLLFVNSLGQSLAMWDQQVESLKDEFRIIRYDHRGHGSSEPDGEAATIEDLSLDTIAVLDAAGLSNVHFVGLSLGGMIGQQIALDEPQRLLSLTLCATATHLPPPEGWEQRAVTALAEGMEPFVETSRGRWFTAAFCQSAPALVDAALDDLRRVDTRGYAACCRAIRDFDVRGRVHSITIPTLLVAGMEDPSTPPRLLQDLHDQMSGSRYEIVDDAAHLLNIEQASTISHLIRQFTRTV
ncbi:3-oxoadipate enol-lactonase [Hoeflea sp.]|uniref:3-oxoadipate enol-lactonase n=1 Tax=Hoeflea sp. TaxID=1940281 RepID=UPI003A8EC8EF